MGNKCVIFLSSATDLIIKESRNNLFNFRCMCAFWRQTVKGGFLFGM